MTPTIHTKGQDNWQPSHQTQWQRERKHGRVLPMPRKPFLARLIDRLAAGGGV